MDIVPDRCACDRTRPEHDACPGNATDRIANVRAVYDRLSWRRTESDTGKPQQDAGRDPRKCH